MYRLFQLSLQWLCAHSVILTTVDTSCGEGFTRGLGSEILVILEEKSEKIIRINMVLPRTIAIFIRFSPNNSGKIKRPLWIFFRNLHGYLNISADKWRKTRSELRFTKIEIKNPSFQNYECILQTILANKIIKYLSVFHERFYFC